MRSGRGQWSGQQRRRGGRERQRRWRRGRWLAAVGSRRVCPFLVTLPGHRLSGRGGQAGEEALVAGARARRQRWDSETEPAGGVKGLISPPRQVRPAHSEAWRGCSAVGRGPRGRRPGVVRPGETQRPIPWGFRSCGVDYNYHYYDYYYYYCYHYGLRY